MSINRTRNIDVLVGMQYGDESKGAISEHLANANNYQWTARVGAQNAEHRFIRNGKNCCARILPSAAAWRPGILAMLGAGHCFRPDLLPIEAVNLGVSADRIFCDPQAMWLKPEHAQSNNPMARTRGTTGWGIGRALAEKVLRDPRTALIGESPELQSYLGSSNIQSISLMIDDLEGPGLIEGSQGALLSLNHGHYPYCTGKDVTVPALLAETGVPIHRVRRIVGVVKLVVSRVPGNSGPTAGRELSFEEIEERTGIMIPQSVRLQGDTQTYGAVGTEREFEFDLEEVRRACILNGPTELAVAFADWHRAGNLGVRDFNKLHQDTRDVIRQLDQFVPVTTIRTGPNEQDVMDRPLVRGPLSKDIVSAGMDTVFSL
jgi:adenylosuccinate synthase